MFEIDYRNIYLGKYTSIAGGLLVGLVTYLLIKGTATLTEATPLLLLALYLFGAKDPKRTKRKTTNCKDEHSTKLH